jgi:hypothetical protein
MTVPYTFANATSPIQLSELDANFAAYSNASGSVSYTQNTNIQAGNFIVGSSYTITIPGTTSWTSIGAANNNVGTTFTATGVGAGSGYAVLQRTVQAKLQEVVSVQDFGADPTGTNDSTEAFTLALATGKDVFVPNGTYLITSTLTMVTPWQSLYGQGQYSILNFTFTSSQPGITMLQSNTGGDAEKAQLHDLKLVGVSNCSQVLYIEASEVRIHDNWFVNQTTGGHGIYIRDLAEGVTPSYETFAAHIFANRIDGTGTTGSYGIRCGNAESPMFVNFNTITLFDILLYVNGTEALFQVTGNLFEASLTGAIYLSGSGNSAPFYNINIVSNYSEANPVFVKAYLGYFKCVNISNNYSNCHQQITPFSYGPFFWAVSGGYAGTTPFIIENNSIEGHTYVFQLDDEYNSRLGSVFNNEIIPGSGGTPTPSWVSGTYQLNAYKIRQIPTYFGYVLSSGSITGNAPIRLEVTTGTLQFPVVYEPHEVAAIPPTVNYSGGTVPAITFQYVNNGGNQAFVTFHSVQGITDTVYSTVTCVASQTYALPVPSTAVGGTQYYIQVVFTTTSSSGYLYPFQLYLYE